MNIHEYELLFSLNNKWLIKLKFFQFFSQKKYFKKQNRINKGKEEEFFAFRTDIIKIFPQKINNYNNSAFRFDTN
ncbi:hypothetical protein BpHYR1_022313 [Brachionus plicatilis]|uniref:Uncharacterized protein n=1 Tax=Brachionus plicatilis TaxID=10195 RepID=A0A3M7S587_BRAPC|nr:hypothetical protein BpHYR1_022313 [Brachionus plicatilis]